MRQTRRTGPPDKWKEHCFFSQNLKTDSDTRIHVGSSHTKQEDGAQKAPQSTGCTCCPGDQLQVWNPGPTPVARVGRPWLDFNFIFKFVLDGLGKDTAVTASTDKRARSLAATLPSKPPPCQQEKSPRNSGPHTCTQLQPRSLGCGIQRHTTMEGCRLRNPHQGRSRWAILFDPHFATSAAPGGGNRRPGYHTSLPAEGRTTGLSPAGHHHQGTIRRQEDQWKNRPETNCRGVVSVIRLCRQLCTRAGARTAERPQVWASRSQPTSASRAHYTGPGQPSLGTTAAAGRASLQTGQIAWAAGSVNPAQAQPYASKSACRADNTPPESAVHTQGPRQFSLAIIAGVDKANLHAGQIAASPGSVSPDWGHWAHSMQASQPAGSLITLPESTMPILK